MLVLILNAVHSLTLSAKSAGAYLERIGTVNAPNKTMNWISHEIMIS